MNFFTTYLTPSHSPRKILPAIIIFYGRNIVFMFFPSLNG